MSVQGSLDDEIAPQTTFSASQDALSDLGDGSSSLSDIEDKEADQDDLEDDGSVDEQGDYREREEDEEDEQDIDIDSDGNDSEAETERLENSPHAARRHKDVIVSSQAESRTYERSPSKLQQSYAPNHDGEEDDVDDLSEPEGSTTESTNKHVTNEANLNSKLIEVPPEGKAGRQKLLGINDPFSKKRKRSLLPERRSPDLEELDEPARKRTGSMVGRGDDFAIDEIASGNEDNGISGPISGELSEANSDVDDGNLDNDDNTAGAVAVKNNTISSSSLDVPQHTDSNKTERHRRSNSRRSGEAVGLGMNSVNGDGPAGESENLQDTPIEEADDHDAEADNEADEADAALKNEEEQERKKLSLGLLSSIQKHFELFKKNLYDERMAQLDREEALLKSDPPTHPQYLELMKCIDARRDERLRIEANLTKLRLETMQRTAVAERSQILAQFHQEVRDIREKTLEKTGRMWYDIQNDRRGYGSQVEEYAIRFPTKRSTQVMQHNQYTKEVSLLAGIAKHVGFPAAPRINGATRDELDADLEKMGKSHQLRQSSQRVSQGLPDLSALRAATSTNSFRPAEEQFIEQTPWANPHHPSHAHLIQRQAAGQQSARTASPFATGVNRRGHATGPTMGLFSGAGHPAVNGAGRGSPSNPFSNAVQKQSQLSQLNSVGSKTPEDALRDDESRADPSKVLSATTFPFDGENSIKREQHMATAGSF